jgi:hypothetical protein
MSHLISRTCSKWTVTSIRTFIKEWSLNLLRFHSAEKEAFALISAYCASPPNFCTQLERYRSPDSFLSHPYQNWSKIVIFCQETKNITKVRHILLIHQSLAKLVHFPLAYIYIFFSFFLVICFLILHTMLNILILIITTIVLLLTRIWFILPNRNKVVAKKKPAEVCKTCIFLGSGKTLSKYA